MQKYGNTFGYFEGTTPIIVTRDVKFLKSFMIKDFSSYVNRRVFDALLLDPIDKFLTVLKDDEWKNVRSLVSSTFTSGKLKLVREFLLIIRQCRKYDFI
jgi:cytochrome P450